jgi:hypothetical protein
METRTCVDDAHVLKPPAVQRRAKRRPPPSAHALRCSVLRVSYVPPPMNHPHTPRTHGRERERERDGTGHQQTPKPTVSPPAGGWGRGLTEKSSASSITVWPCTPPRPATATKGGEVAAATTAAAVALPGEEDGVEGISAEVMEERRRRKTDLPARSGVSRSKWTGRSLRRLVGEGEVVVVRPGEEEEEARRARRGGLPPVVPAAGEKEAPMAVPAPSLLLLLRPVLLLLPLLPATKMRIHSSSIPSAAILCVTAMAGTPTSSILKYFPISGFSLLIFLFVGGKGGLRGQGGGLWW